MAWNPEQYRRFSAPRRQPFDDLVALVRPAPNLTVVDLGCGTGELTAELHERLSARQTLGIDTAPAMIAEACRLTRPGLTFEARDIAGFSPSAPFDLVFSNAALQWLPDHPRLFTEVFAAVAPGGQLAVQVPSNQDHAAHRIAREVSPGFSPTPAHIPEVLSPVQYAELLTRAGFLDVHVRQQVYIHWLNRPEEVVEWMKGTLLTAWQECLSPGDYEVFLRFYWTRLVRALPDERPFFFLFKRILMWARKPA